MTASAVTAGFIIAKLDPCCNALMSRSQCHKALFVNPYCSRGSVCSKVKELLESVVLEHMVNGGDWTTGLVKVVLSVWLKQYTGV